MGTLLGKEFLAKIPGTLSWDVPWICLKLATKLGAPTALTPPECGGLREAVYNPPAHLLGEGVLDKSCLTRPNHPKPSLPASAVVAALYSLDPLLASFLPLDRLLVAFLAFSDLILALLASILTIFHHFCSIVDRFLSFFD